MQSCRSILDEINIDEGENASLLMARYIKNLDDNQESKRKIFSAMKNSAKLSKNLYALAFKNRRKFLREIAVSRRFRTSQPLIAGLGSSNVTETGLALNHLYGLPILHGSSIKGITANYAFEILDREIYEALFGKAPAENETDQEEGSLKFYDAWILPESLEYVFADDVMTPHHSDYYSKKQDRPTDFDKPVPLNFLTVRGEFEFWIGCGKIESDIEIEWVDFAFDLVEATLRNYGIGGKIKSGYGKMERIKTPEEIHAETLKQQNEFNMKAGFKRKIGEVVEVICTKKYIKKGKEKRDFDFAEKFKTDKKSLHFQTPPKVEQDYKFNAKIIDINRSGNAYILQALL